jgi:ABC-2 type transport system permease protein
VKRHFLGDTVVLLGRSLRHVTRSPDTIITTAVMPIAFMLLFVYVFGGAIQHGPGTYVTYLLPGILLITIASGISYTAFRLFTDMQGGIFAGAGALAWLAVAGILPLFTLALTWIAVIPGLSAKSVDGVSAFSYPLIFLPFTSSAFVPTGTMPGPVRAFADNQPVTSIVNTIRHLFAQQPVGAGVWTALAWCLGILVVAYVLAMATYHRKIA